MSSTPWGARSTTGNWRARTRKRHVACSLPVPTEDEIADIMELSATPEGAAALADGLATLVARSRDSGTFALHLYQMGRAEASWVASWMEALTGGSSPN